MKPSRNPALCWLFVDTTGLHVTTDEVIGVACARGAFETYERFAPTHAVDWNELGQINGYHPDTWGPTADRDKRSLVAVQRTIAGSVLAGHSLILHGMFLRKLFQDVGLAYPSTGEKRIELERVFAPLYMIGLVEAVALGALAEAMGIHMPKPACAWDRLDVARDVYDRYFEALGLPT
jgi:hypothetical protein